MKLKLRLWFTLITTALLVAAVARVNEISSNNRDSINVTVKELSRFKAENAEKGGNRAAA